MPKTDPYKRVLRQSRTLGERNDCVVKAITILTVLPYEQVHAACAEAGRKSRQGMFDYQWKKACDLLGYDVEYLHYHDLYGYETGLLWDMMKNHYGGYQCQQVTTKHPSKFSKAWREHGPGDCILGVNGHVAAYKDGQVHDWSTTKACRVKGIYKLTKRSTT